MEYCVYNKNLQQGGQIGSTGSKGHCKGHRNVCQGTHLISDEASISSTPGSDTFATLKPRTRRALSASPPSVDLPCCRVKHESRARWALGQPGCASAASGLPGPYPLPPSAQPPKESHPRSQNSHTNTAGRNREGYAVTRPPPPQLLVNACVLTRFSQPSRGPGGAFHHKDISSPVSLSARRRAQQTNAGVAFSGATNSREAHHKSRGRWRPDARRLFCRPGSKPEAPLPLFPCPGEAVNRPRHVAPRGFPGRGRAQRADTEAKRGRVGGPAPPPVLSQKTAQGGRVSLRARRQEAEAPAPRARGVGRGLGTVYAPCRRARLLWSLRRAACGPLRLPERCL